MLQRAVRITIYLLLGLIVALLVGLTGLYLRTPSWYRPTRLTVEQQQEATSDLNGKLSWFNKQANAGQADRRFDLVLTQQEVNRYLQALPLYHPRARLPEGLSDPMIVFRKDRLILAGRYRLPMDRPLSLHLKFELDEAGLAVAVDSVQAGSLPLPQQFVRDQLSELTHRLARATRTTSPGRQAEREPTTTRMIASLKDAFFAAVNGEPMPRQFVTYGANRAVRLDAIELSEGQLRLTFVPLGRPTWTEPPEMAPPETFFVQPATRPKEVPDGPDAPELP